MTIHPPLLHRPLYEGKRCTYTESLRLEEDGFQYEIIEGVMRMVPAHLYNHQLIVTILGQKFLNFLDKQDLGRVCVAPRDVKLAENLKYQPDVLFILKERLAINLPQYVDGAPDLVVEVISKGTMSQDTRTKFDDYEKYGVKEYWILNPGNMEASEFYELIAGKYQPFYPDGSVLSSKLLADFSIDLGDLDKRSRL